MLLFAVTALAAPIRATTETGRPVLLNDNGSWTWDTSAPEPAGDRVGDWVVDLETSAVKGGTVGGATTPNLYPGGSGYLGITCYGKLPVLVMMFSRHGLRDIDVKERPPAFAYEGVFVLPFRDGTRDLAGPAFIRGDVEGYTVPADKLFDVLSEEPRPILAAANKRPGRTGWPGTVRYSLDGFLDAWDRVAVACKEHPAR